MKKVLLLAAMFCMLLSCTKEEISFEERIPINISVGQQTKANDSNFNNGDKVGIYVVNYTDNDAGVLAISGNQVDNMGFTYTESAWDPASPVYWKDKKTSADFYAYYPYSTNVTDVTAHPFSVKADQRSEANFWASDFLWGKAEEITPTSSAVPIVTNHVLSRIIVEIKPGDGFTNATLAEALESVVISGLKTSAKIDLSTGISTEDGDAQEITPFYDSETGYYKAMIIPQTTVEESKLIVITTKDGTKYVYRKGYKFKANTQHKFTVTVNRSSACMNVTIGEWLIDDTDNNGVAEEEGAPFIEFNQETVEFSFENCQKDLYFKSNLDNFNIIIPAEAQSWLTIIPNPANNNISISVNENIGDDREAVVNIEAAENPLVKISFTVTQDAYYFNENNCLYYRANTTGGWDSGHNNYRATSSYITCGAGGAIMEMKFKLSQPTANLDIYLAAGGNLAKDGCDWLRLNNYGLYISLESSDDLWYYNSWKWEDLGVALTDLITLRFSSVDETLTINGKVIQCPGLLALGWSYIFSNYYREYDEGEWKEYEGVPEGSALYYVRMYDKNGEITYIGHPKSYINPTSGVKEYCWYSNTPSQNIQYQYANDYQNQGGYTGNF